jgi:hypothetical protein
MKENAKKPWLFKAISLAVLFVAFFFNLGILFLPLSGTHSTLSIWGYMAVTSSDQAGERFYAIGLVVLFFLFLVPLGFSVAAFFRKKKGGFYAAVIYLLVEDMAVLLYHAVFRDLSGGAIALAILAFVMALGVFALLIFDKETPSESPVKTNPNANKVAAVLLGISIFSLVALLVTLLAVPLYDFTMSSTTYTCVLGGTIVGKSTQKEDAIFLLVNLLLFFLCLLYFIGSLSYYVSDKKKFVKRAKYLMGFELGVAGEFFIMGFIIEYIYALKGLKSGSLSFIPLLFMGLASLVFAIFKGRFDLAVGPEEEQARVKKEAASPKRIELLLGVVILTLVTVGSLFLNIIDVTFQSSAYGSEVKLTGIKLLQDYASLGSGYQVLAFVIVVMLLCSGVGLLITLMSFFSKDRRFANIARAVAGLNIFFMFIFGVSGYYFSIATEITADSTKKVLAYYNINYDSSYKYSIKTDVIYLFFADVAILLFMIFRKLFSFESLPETSMGEEAPSLPESPEVSPKAAEPKKEEIPDNTPTVFDPCPAFSELDGKAEAFKADLAAREKLSVGKTSLNDLVRFVVEYAKDSRLHLSYNAQDIAAFVSGLGAARLTILQGMSGTGKTSLPKIFAEAIDGNCDLIEVESSWKDKNELLGYYNEFSEKYTPKKFTQALYKAALNPTIPTFIVLDEMNLSRIEYYFSDFLSLMENEEDKRQIQLLNVELVRKTESGTKDYLALEEGHTLKVPSNIWFIGTANRDESTFVISDKVYDRAHTMNFNKRAPKVRDASSEPIPQRYYSYAVLDSLFTEAKKNGTFDAENSELIRQCEALLSPFNISFGNRILKQIEDFVDIYKACFPLDNVENEAVESILLSKVVSKLEVKTIDNKEDLVKAFQNLNLLKCADFVNKLNED